jgi:hypothetical protein
MPERALRGHLETLGLALLFWVVAVVVFGTLGRACATPRPPRQDAVESR